MANFIQGFHVVNSNEYLVTALKEEGYEPSNVQSTRLEEDVFQPSIIHL